MELRSRHPNYTQRYLHYMEDYIDGVEKDKKSEGGTLLAFDVMLPLYIHLSKWNASLKRNELSY